MHKIFKGASSFFGNGTIYLTYRNRAYRLREHNFRVESLGETGAEVYMNGGIVVAIGSENPLKEVAVDLRAVLTKVERELSKNPKAQTK